MRRLASVCLAALGLAGCAPQACSNPYVLDFVAAADRKAELAHLGLVRDSVRTDPTLDPDVADCAVWQRLRNPAGGPPLLQAQHFQVRRVENGWRVILP